MLYCAICDKKVDPLTYVPVSGHHVVCSGSCRAEWVRKELLLDELFLPDPPTQK